MNIVSFLFLLSAFSVITSLVVEAVKKFVSDKENRNYNSIALVVALIIGLVGTLLFFYFTNVHISGADFIFAILMGLASALVSMVGYDKVKDAIKEFNK